MPPPMSPPDAMETTNPSNPIPPLIPLPTFLQALAKASNKPTFTGVPRVVEAEPLIIGASNGLADFLDEDKMYGEILAAADEHEALLHRLSTNVMAHTRAANYAVPLTPVYSKPPMPVAAAFEIPTGLRGPRGAAGQAPVAAASLSLPALPIPRSESHGTAAPLGRLRSALAVTKLLQARLGKFGTSFEQRAREVEMGRVLAAAERRALLDKALVLTAAAAATTAKPTPDAPMPDMPTLIEEAPLVIDRPKTTIQFIAPEPKIDPAALQANTAAAGVSLFAAVNWYRLATAVTRTNGRKPIVNATASAARVVNRTTTSTYSIMSENMPPPPVVTNTVPRMALPRKAEKLPTRPPLGVNTTATTVRSRSRNPSRSMKRGMKRGPTSANTTTMKGPQTHVYAIPTIKLLPPPPVWQRLLPWHHSHRRRRRANATLAPSLSVAVHAPPSSASPVVYGIAYNSTGVDGAAHPCRSGRVRCLPAPRRRVVRCLPAPCAVGRKLLPCGWQPAGLLSWAGAETFRALVTRDVGVPACTGGTGAGDNSSSLRAANRSVVRLELPLPSDTCRHGALLARAKALPPPSRSRIGLQPNCTSVARMAAAAAARMVKAQAEVAIGAAVMAAAHSEASLASRTAELAEASAEATRLREQLRRVQQAAVRKAAHLTQVEAALQSKVSIEAKLLTQMDDLKRDLRTLRRAYTQERAANTSGANRYKHSPKHHTAKAGGQGARKAMGGNADGGRKKRSADYWRRELAKAKAKARKAKARGPKARGPKSQPFEYERGDSGDTA